MHWELLRQMPLKQLQTEAKVIRKLTRKMLSLVADQQEKASFEDDREVLDLFCI